MDVAGLNFSFAQILLRQAYLCFAAAGVTCWLQPLHSGAVTAAASAAAASLQ